MVIKYSVLINDDGFLKGKLKQITNKKPHDSPGYLFFLT